MALRVCQVERGDDVAVDDGRAAHTKGRSVRHRHDLRGTVDDRLEASDDCRIGRARDAEDDGEASVAAVAEMSFQDRPYPLRVGAGHREGVGLELRELREAEP